MSYIGNTRQICVHFFNRQPSNYTFMFIVKHKPHKKILKKLHKKLKLKNNKY